MAKGIFVALEDLENEDSAVYGDTPYGEGIDEADSVAAKSFDDLSEYNESVQNLNDAGLVLEGLLSLENLRTNILAKENISQEDFNLYKVAYEQFSNTFNIQRSGLETSLESATDFRMALEKAGSDHKGIYDSVMDFFSRNLKGVANGFTFLTSFFSDYEKVSNKMEKKIEEVKDGEKADVEIKVSRYLVYGDDKVCESIDEYKKALRESVDAISKLIKNFDSFVSHNGIFGELRSMISYLRSKEGEEKFLAPYFSIYEQLIKLIDLGEGQTVKSSKIGGTDRYTSKIFLGEWNTRIHDFGRWEKALKIKESNEDVKIKLKQMRSLFAGVDFAIGEISYENKTHSVTFKDVTKKDLEEIHSIIKELGPIINDFKRLGNKFKTFMNSYVKFIRPLFKYFTPESYLISLGFSLLFARNGLVSKTSTLVSLNVGELYKISRGLMGSASSVVDSSASKLK